MLVLTENRYGHEYQIRYFERADHFVLYRDGHEVRCTQTQADAERVMVWDVTRWGQVPRY